MQEKIAVTILYVEDEIDILQAFSEIMGRWVVKLYVAGNGLEGLAQFEKYQPDIIISDIKMPKMDGLEMCRRIKEINPKVKTVIMSAHSDADYFINAIELGIDGFLLKPIFGEKLKKLIQRFANEVVLEKQLQKANNDLLDSEHRLRLLNATKDLFFSIIAHDLKNPFTAQMGFARIIKNQFDTLNKSKIIEYVDLIYNASEHSYKLLENLLEWSRSQTGKINYKPTNIGLNWIIADVVQLLNSTAVNKEITIKNQIHNETKVYADENMLKTILRNLISNAIKFTPRGGVIKLELTTEPSVHNGFVEISITDNGVGIEEKNLNKLFRIEQKLSTYGTEDERGTGLGLILCKEFISKHGGDIKVESKKNIGSTFRFTIPKELKN
jgi:signal transduction histidine kinase